MTADVGMALIVVPVRVMGGIPAIFPLIIPMTLQMMGIPLMMPDLILQTTAGNPTVRMMANRIVPLQIPEDLQQREGDPQKTGYSGG
jgi:hypothetical protein